MQTEISSASVANGLFCELFEVGIHCILFAREVYPDSAFRKKSKYNVPIDVCVHPAVHEYVGSVLDTLRPLVATGRVESASVLLLTERGRQPVEKFVFELQPPRADQSVLDPVSGLAQAERPLRSLLLKLKLSPALLNTSHPEYTWAVQVKTTKYVLYDVEQQQVMQDFPWVEAEERDTRLRQPRILPLRSVHSPLLKMQLHVEEAQHVTPG